MCGPHPVSYTHLDVYKRQVYDLWRGGRCLVIKELPMKDLQAYEPLDWGEEDTKWDIMIHGDNHINSSNNNSIDHY